MLPVASQLSPPDKALTLATFEPLTAFPKVALAVSGGSDSMALMYWAAHWRELLSASTPAPKIVILTVDHGLRAASRQETEFVCQHAARLGFPCQILEWKGEKPQTGIQAAARLARYDLMIEFCRTHGVKALVTAHHRDDQAETVYMNLARGSGIDGLAGIAPRLEIAGLSLLRPLLHLSKRTLLHLLRALGGDYCEDPSNQDRSFERVRVRQLLRQAENQTNRAEQTETGLAPAALARTANRSRRARQALDFYTERFLEQTAVLNEWGIGQIALDKFHEAPEEIRLRTLIRLLSVIGGQARDPALSAVEELLLSLTEDRFSGRTLGGCVVRERNGKLLIHREGGRRGPSAMRVTPGASIIWDERFRVRLAPTAPLPLIIRSLGEAGLEALKSCSDKPNEKWAFSGTIATVLPSIWSHNGILQAVPHIGFYRRASLRQQIEITHIAVLTGEQRQNLRHLG